MVSIIIRTKNEEKWITSCLKSVFSQSYKDFEVIIVDNKSTDKTVKKAKAFDVKVLKIEKFLPGKALNDGIKYAKGDIIVSLSGHCIPTNNQWLANLIRNLKDKKTAGVYGRQEPLAFTVDSDKRDLLTIFGLDKKVQKKDPFFHNANSAIRRDVWEKIPFDEKVTHIEDRVWGMQVISQGYQIVYEPMASIYHYHGIHQDGEPQRCQNVVRILESLGLPEDKNKKAILDIEGLNIAALIPVKGDIEYCGKRPLIDYTIERVRQSRFVNRIIVSTDNEKLAEVARRSGADTPFLRPEELSREYVDISMVLQYSLEQLEKKNVPPDLIVVLEVTYPFRPHGFIDEVIVKLIKGGFDSIVPVKAEYRSVWFADDRDTKILGKGFMPRQLKESRLYISLLGLGFVTYPHFIREGRLSGEKVGIIEVVDPYSQLEVRGREAINFAGKFIDGWWDSNKEGIAK